MIVIMNSKAKEEDVQTVLAHLEERGCETFVSKLNKKTVVVANGNK